MKEVGGTMRSTLKQPEFWLLLVGMTGAMLGVSFWVVVPLMAAGLSISSLPKYVALWPRARAAGGQGMWWRTVALSTGNTVVTSLLSAWLGRFIAWGWGLGL